MTRTNKRNKERKRNTSKCSPEFAFMFAERLKIARKHAGLTQETVAEKLEIECRTYQRYESSSESDNVVPNLEVIVKLTQVLDCDITYFTGENKEDEFNRDTAAASETTGLNYKTIEILEAIKNSNKADNEEYINKCILFVLDFLLQHTSGRWLFWNMFQYLFKEYLFIREGNGGGSNVIELEADPIVSERNVALFVNDISGGVFFSNIMEGITKIKVKENTVNLDTSDYDYIPTKEEILKKIAFIDDRIQSIQDNSYKEYNPYTPKYALEFQHFEDTGEWKPRDTLAELVTKRVNFDYYNDSEIEKLKRLKEEALLEYQTLYPEETKKTTNNR